MLTGKAVAAAADGAMSTVESILRLLEKWPAWKRMTATPDRVDALEKKIAELEERLRRAPGEACPRCGTLEYRTREIVGSVHFIQCGDCGLQEERVVPRTGRR